MPKNVPEMVERFRYGGPMSLFRSTPTVGGASEQASDQSVAEVLRVASDRLAEVVAAAERAASEIEVVTAKRLGKVATDSEISRERIVAELMHSLATRASDLRGEAHDLAGVLARSRRRLATSETAPSPAPKREDSTPSPAATPAVAPAKSSGGAPPKAVTRLSPLRRRKATADDSSAPPTEEGLRLLATQMAIAGSTQTEIVSHFRSKFGLKDANTILQGISTPGPRGS